MLILVLFPRAFTAGACRLGFVTLLFNGRDTTYIAAEFGMWTLAEVATMILCTCFPMMPRFGKTVTTAISANKSRLSFFSLPPDSKGSDTPQKGRHSTVDHYGQHSKPFASTRLKDGDAQQSTYECIYLDNTVDRHHNNSPPLSPLGPNAIRKTVTINLTSEEPLGRETWANEVV